MSKVGRNDSCPCGSGLKFKKCCGGNAAVEVAVSASNCSIQLSESGRQSGWLHYPTESYQRMMEAVAFTEDLKFWTQCARLYGAPVLCLACGLGREAFHLAKEGFAAVGVDMHEGFIEVAEREKVLHASVLKAPLHFNQADVVTMQLKEKFPLAIMPTVSFQLILTEADQRVFLKNLRAHLADKGMFIFDLNRVFADGNRFVNVKGERVGSYSANFDRMPRMLNHGPLYQRLSTLEEIQVLLFECGFEIVSVQDAPARVKADFREQPVSPGKASAECTVLARKV